MVVINFSHPFTPEQFAQFSALLGRPVDCVLSVPVQLDHDQPFEPQIEQIVAGISLTPDEWQTAPIIVNLPALNVAAALLLAELHGRMGHFPPVARLQPVAGELPPRYAVAEVLNLQAVRDRARRARQV